MKYPNASEGLKLMFYGEIVAIVGVVLSIVPLVGALLSIIGGIVALVGLNKARPDDRGYQTAFILTIVNIVVDLFYGLAGTGLVSTLLSVASSVLSLAALYYVVNTTCNLLHSMGAGEIEAKGRAVWSINLVCTIVSVAVNILTQVPIIGILATVGMVVVVIAALVGYVLYLIFLNKAYPALV